MTATVMPGLPALPALPPGAAPHSPSSRGPRAAEAGPRDPARVAESFEALFLHALLEPLEQSAGALFGEGVASRVLAGLFRQQLADELARSRPLGIAGVIEKTLNPKSRASTDEARRAAESYRKAER